MRERISHAVDDIGNNAFMMGIVRGHDGIVKLLYEAGASVNKDFGQQEWKSFLEIYSPSLPEMVKAIHTLLDHFPFQSDPEGTALLLASLFNQPNIVRTLMELGIDGDRPIIRKALEVIRELPIYDGVVTVLDSIPQGNVDGPCIRPVQDIL